MFNIFKRFFIILASYSLFSDFTGHCSLFVIKFFVNVPTVFTKKISPFPAPREEWKEETKEETKGGQRVARGSLSSGQDIVFENKMPFT